MIRKVVAVEAEVFFFRDEARLDEMTSLECGTSAAGESGTTSSALP